MHHQQLYRFTKLLYVYIYHCKVKKLEVKIKFTCSTEEKLIQYVQIWTDAGMYSIINNFKYYKYTIQTAPNM